MKFNGIFFVCFLWTLLACADLTGQKDRYASFLEKGEKVMFEDYQSMVTKTREGAFRYRQFFPEKMLLTDLVTFSDEARTIPHGPHLAWFDNGHRKLVASYGSGMLQGPYREYAYSNDSLIRAGAYAYGEKTGEWVSYYDSGQARKRENFVEGIREGEFTAYDTLGLITEQGLLRADTVYSYIVGQAPDPDLTEVMPQFPGCEEVEDKTERATCANRKMLEFVYKNLRYPFRAIDKGISGKSESSFVVEKDGTISDVQVMHGLSRDISKEVERIISSMPTWHPGIQDGKPVRVRFLLPVTFKLQ